MAYSGSSSKQTIMAGSRRRRQQLQRQRERQLAAPAPAAAPAPGYQFQLHHLLPDLLPEIHHRLAFLTRLAFASVCGASGSHLKETPCLILAKQENDECRARVHSMADGESADVRISDVAMRGHVAIGSSGGWLVTADDRGALRMANPATGAHADLPAITTVPFIRPVSGGHWFSFHVEPFLKVRFGQPRPPPAPGHGYDYTTARSYTVTAAQMRQVMYCKVVLSESPRPDSYAAMLIFERSIGAPAFATTEDTEPSWRMARSPDAVEDAIHHDGRFVSITYTGRVQAWQRDAETGEFTSQEVAPRLAYEDEHLRRMYIAASTDGRLMAVLKHAREEQDDGDGPYYASRDKHTRVSFKVQMLDRVKGRWEEAADIGDTAIFVGVNGSLCLSTREHKGIKPGCVYFTDDEVGAACLKKANCHQRSYSYGEPVDKELRDVGAYNLKAGRREAIPALGEHRLLWPPPAWFTPSFL